MANSYNRQFFQTKQVAPVLLSCNFIVDSQNANGLGIRSLKGAGIANVYMLSDAAPSGSLALNSSRSYAILGASAVTNTGSSVLTGNLGLTPGTSVTGFPPGTFSGVENVANTAVSLAQSQALAAFTAGNAKTPTPITAALDGQTLTPGVYSESSGTFNLAASGNGTLILNGAGVYIFQCSSTLVTGAGGIPTITLSGGALAQNVYWLVGSSATINSGTAGIFQGNIIAHTSITDTSGGTVNGSLIALTGAVTLSAASNVLAQPLAGTPSANNPNPAAGEILVQLSENYNRFLGAWGGFVSPLSGSTLTSSVANVINVIVSLGTASLAQWQAAGLPKGIAPAVGAAFIGKVSGVIGGSAAVQLRAPNGSGVDHIEVVGDPNVTLANSMIQNPAIQLANGGYISLACFSNTILTAPADGTVVGLEFYMSNSSVLIAGE